MTNLEEYQLLVEKDKLFQENKKLKRAFEIALETMVLHYLHDPEDRKRIAGELMEYYLDKVGEGMKHCPYCGKPISQADLASGNVFLNGGGQFGEDPHEVWHETCAEEAEEWERENNKRR
jgi:hypothetical protein